VMSGSASPRAIGHGLSIIRRQKPARRVLKPRREYVAKATPPDGLPHHIANPESAMIIKPDIVTRNIALRTPSAISLAITQVTSCP